MTNKDLQIKNLQLENYHLKEEIRQFQNDLDYLKEAITTVENEYRLKQHIDDSHIQLKSKICLECIKEINQQLELIRLREEGGTI